MKKNKRQNLSLNKEFLDVRNISKSYLIRGQRRSVLMNIRFGVAKDEFISIIGPSGSGKSTLFNCLIGLENVDDGTIFYGDQNFTDLTENDKFDFINKHVGFVCSQNNLLDFLTPSENILLQMQTSKVSNHTKTMADLINFLELDSIANIVCEKLDFYEQTIVAIAKALSKDTQILILDEPDARLNSLQKEKLVSLLKKIHKELRIPVLIFSADPIIPMASGRVIRIKDGKIN
ncbi:MAG: peptide ABC transporter ATP-binding protein [Candidatus Dojkabacteria bacterium]|nr:MAG: peptide ABC transporter ATP-binding protein [Candidatus Dojkabacteria bacterium]